MRACSLNGKSSDQEAESLSNQAQFGSVQISDVVAIELDGHRHCGLERHRFDIVVIRARPPPDVGSAYEHAYTRRGIILARSRLIPKMSRPLSRRARGQTSTGQPL